MLASPAPTERPLTTCSTLLKPKRFPPTVQQIVSQVELAETKAQARNKQQGTVRGDGEKVNTVTKARHIGLHIKA